MPKNSLKACLVLLSLAAGGPALSAPAATPTVNTQLDPAAKQICGFYDALLDTMKHAKELGVTGRYKKLGPAIDAVFDFATMTKLTIGPDWTNMSDADRKMLTDAFRRMTIADYAHNFDGYDGETFAVTPTVQERAGDKIVNSQMTVTGKDPIPFLYRMTQMNGSWKIIDIYLNGYVSEVATRRADFASTLKSGGAPLLVQKLNALTDTTLKQAP